MSLDRAQFKAKEPELEKQLMAELFGVQSTEKPAKVKPNVKKEESKAEDTDLM